jgi:two-component system OmpR family response regulator
MEPRSVLIVDDDPATRDLIAAYLSRHDFGVACAADGLEMNRLLRDGHFDLVVLDLKLPDQDGLRLLRDLRGHSDVPVVVLTGHRPDEVDRIIGLEIGADDYLTKPASLRELLARIRAILRRAERPAAASDQARPRARYRFAGWQLAVRTRQLVSPEGRPVQLTRGEFGLLLALLQAPRQILSRDQLLTATRLHEDEVFDRSIDVQILRLRRKLEVEPSRPQIIRTERGVGYVLAVPVESL